MSIAAAMVAIVGCGNAVAVETVTDLEPKYAAELALVAERMTSDPWKAIERVEMELEQMPQQPMPLNHIFTPKLYLRQVFMPKGTLVTTRIHLTEHPFIISAGIVSVWDDENGWVTLRAAHAGVTKPGTRRILFVHEDCIWTTCHVTDKTDPDEIVKQVTFCGGKFSELRGAAALPQERQIA